MLALGASITAVGLEAAVPLLTKVAVDDAVAQETGRLWPIVAGMLALGAFAFAAAFVRRYSAGRLALDVQHDLRRAVFAAMQRLDGGKQDALRTGQVVSRSISDLQLVNALLSMMPLAAGTAVLAVFAISAMLWMSPLLTVVALIVAPLVGVVSARSKKRLFPATWSAQHRAADIAQHVEETVTGVRVVKGFGQEGREVEKLRERARRLFGERMRAARLTSLPTASLAALPGDVPVIRAEIPIADGNRAPLCPPFAVHDTEPFEIALLYSLTLEASEPEYVTRMHAAVGPLPEPGFWLRALYRTPVVASLSPIATVPASMRLPGFDVVAVKAAEVENTATPAMRASTATVVKILRLRPCLSFEFIPPLLCSVWVFVSVVMLEVRAAP